jgi:outer membrane protein
MRRCYLAIVWLFFAPWSLKAQEPIALSLQNCIDYGISHSYTMKNAQLDVLIQQAQNDQTMALAMPKVSAKADYNYFIKPQSSFLNAQAFGGPDVETSVAFSLFHASSLSFNASQILFDGSVLVALQARNTILELSKQNAKISEATLKYNIFKTYYNTVITQKQFDIFKQSLSYLRTVDREVSVLYENGLVEKIDVDRIKVQVSTMSTDSAKLKNLVNLSEQVLKYLIGMDINAAIKLTDNDLDSHVASAANLLLDAATDYNRVPEFNVLNTALNLNMYNLKRYQLSVLPTLAAYGALGTNLGSDKFSNLSKFRRYESNSLVGVSLSMPIFGGFQRVHQLRESRLNIEKSKNNIESLKQGLDFQAEQAKTSLRNALLQLQTQKKNTELATSVYDLSIRKYKEGVGNNSEITQAQSEQLKVQSSYFSTLVELINAEADLKKALGLLN